MRTLRTPTFLTLLLAISGTAQAQLAHPNTVRLSPIKDGAEKIKTFSQIKDDLSRSEPATKLLGCPTLIDYVEDMPSGHDTSFGAVCNVRTRGKIKRVTLCDDRMVGKFFESDQAAEGHEQIGLFVQAHCPPGG